MIFPIEGCLNVTFGWWHAQDDIRLEGWALMLGVRHKCRAQHARGKLQLTLCDNFALTLSLAKSRSSSAPLNTTCRGLCAVRISSLSIGSHQNGIPQSALRDFFCDARNVGAEAASLERATRGEARRHTDSKEVASHCSLKEITSLGTSVLTKRRLVSDTPSYP